MKSNEPAVLMPAISALREQVKDESMVSATIDRLVIKESWPALKSAVLRTESGDDLSGNQ
jgi:hypothetical protein